MPHDRINFIWDNIKSKNISLNEFNNLVTQLRSYYTSEEERQNTIFKDYIDCRNSFFNEVEPIKSVAMHLKKKGEMPDRVMFCAHDQNLGYDGVFERLNAKNYLEVTRAAEDTGQNEQLRRELLASKGIAPYGQPIESHGTKHNRTFGPNIPRARRINISEFSTSLQKAFDNKNKDKYQGLWLIITLPEHWGQLDLFYKGCLEFWSNVQQSTGVFTRIFIVSEEYIKSGKESPVWDSSYCNDYIHYANW